MTFGDESAVTSDRWTLIISVVTIFLIWGAFTGSVIVPIHVLGPFVGETLFTYTAEAPDGSQDDAQVAVRVFEIGVDSETGPPEIEPGPGFAKNDGFEVGAWRSVLARVDKNDEITKSDGAKIVAIDGEAVNPGDTVKVDNGILPLAQRERQTSSQLRVCRWNQFGFPLQKPC